MYTFNVDTGVHVVKFIGESLIILGIVISIILTVYYILVHRTRKDSTRLLTSIIVLFFVLMLSGSTFFFLNSNTTSQIVIGQNQITVSGQFIGNNTYNSDQISYAFMENINSGNITFSSRNMGTSIGFINEGRYTLSNGASADVITNNATVMVVKLTSGSYLVLGCSNSLSMAKDFASDVHPVSGL